MTPEPVGRIVITKEELLDPSIDEQLAQRRNVVPGSLQPLEEKGGFRLFYATWFYLLLAGLCGALAGWAVIEPYLEDGILFTGRVQEVGSSDVQPNIRSLKISGLPVFVHTAKTTIRGGLGNQVNYTVDDLRVDSVVKLRGAALEQGDGLFAEAIRIEPPGTPAPAEVDLAGLKSKSTVAAAAMFPMIAGMIGLLIGAAEGIICRTRARAVRCGLFGLAAGVGGGFVSMMAGGLIYQALGGLAEDPTASSGAFMLQMFRRGLAWTIIGTAVGLGQGMALKSRRLLLNGLIGGMLGGLIGGLVFDPISLVFSNPAMLSGAGLSRGIGFGIIGAMVGVMIGVTDLLTRSAWLRVTAGPLRGKEFSFYQTPIRLGSSPKNEIYLFKDPRIEPVHSTINKLRDTYEIEDHGSASGTIVNGQRIQRKRLADGDRIAIGESELVYTTRDKKKTG
jgi:hypothetical protein